LKDLYDEFGDWYLAMAGYNAGPGRVTRGIQLTGASSFWQLADRKVLPTETINYVPNILALAIIGKNPENYGFSVTPQTPWETDRVNVEHATDLRVIAEILEVPVENLRELNPHVLRWTTPPDDADFQLNLPAGYHDKFTELVAALPENERILFRHHVVRKGETLSAIARKYGTGVTDITQANRLNVRRPLQIGQELMIPLSGNVTPAVRAAAQAASKATPPSTTTYTVRRGDTLSGIASRFSVSVGELKSWNGLSSNLIGVGKILRVAPPAGATVSTADTSATEQRTVVHRVQRGETLAKIASTYQTTVNAILSWNNRNDLTVIYPGDQFTIHLGNDD
jgi:membrane-bound lytic murein transglycosylase D